MRIVISALMLLLANQVLAENLVAWPGILIDPAVNQSGPPADLVLPMPCGGGMAFQRVNVPVEVSRPLADRTFRMGQSNAKTAFSDYLKTVHLRGAFNDSEAGVSYYYIGRYELNQAQYRAIVGDCTAPFTPPEARAKGNLSWYQAVDLSRSYSEWLMQNAREFLPSEGDRMGFVRLPTEPEWEYAARGGARVNPSTFASRRFFVEGSLADFAVFRAPGRGTSGLQIIGGRRLPNPLGLYDIYGNVEELMLEHFRLNAIGRVHGQLGGLVTRGGSVDLEETQIYTAQRNEYPMFSAHTGQALASEFFGVRFVLSSNIVSEDRFTKIRDSWIAEADRPADADTDPLVTVAELLEQETDPRRRNTLSGLQLEFRVAREAAASSLTEAAKSTLLSGAAFVQILLEDTSTIDQLQRDSLALRDRVQISVGDERIRLIEVFRQNVEQLESLRADRETYLLSYRLSLETLADFSDRQRQNAYTTLIQELESQKQSRLLETLKLFYDDLTVYSKEPDMDSAMLLQTAIQ